LANGTLQYTGVTATTDRGFTLAAGPSVNSIEVSSAGTNLTFGGQVTGSGGLTKAGPGILTLTNTANNYSGGTTSKDFGYLRVSDMAAPGSGGLTLLGNGYLQYTGTTAGWSTPVVIGSGSGGIRVETGGTNLILSGTISES